MRADKVYLVGFMGAGKSTVAHALATRLGWSAEDLDARIEASEGRSIAQIFSQDGEAYFRQIEQAALRELIPPRRAVVATGGGTFADPANRQIIASDGVSVWLDVSLDTAVRRLPPHGTRPLAGESEQLLALWNARRPAYTLAELYIDADRSLDDVVIQIIDGLDT